MSNEDMPVGPEPEQLDPGWWSSVLPASAPVDPRDADTAAADPLGPPGWQPPEVVSSEIRRLAKSAPPGSLQHEVLSAMADASSAMLEPENWAEPFRPMAEWTDGSRTVLPSDIDAGRIALLAAAAPLVENVPMRARLADVAWTYGDRSNMATLDVALDAYLALPLERWAWHMVSRDGWQRAVEVLQRRGNAETARRDVILARVLTRVLDGTLSDGFMLVDLANLYLQAGNGNTDTKRQVADHFVALAGSTTVPRFGRHLERTAHRLLTALSESDDAHAATVRIAELYVTDADRRLESGDGSALAAGMDLEKAITALKRLPRKYRLAHGIEARIDELRRRLADNREAALDSMTAIEMDPVNIADSVRAAERAVTGRPKLEALVRLASIESLNDAEKSFADAKESLEGGIARLFARSTFAADGRKVASSAGSSGTPGEAELLSNVVRYFSVRVGLVVNARIMPALDVITVEHRYDMAFLRRVCWDSPTVPPGHVDLWARGLWHGLNNDFPSAVSILVPQAEQLLRHRLKEAGEHTLFIDPVTGTETEKGLSALVVMNAARDILGPDLQLEMRALLVEQEGANLRNEIAHGLLTDGAAWSAEAVYAWWLLLRVVVVPLWVALSADVTGGIDGERGDDTVGTTGDVRGGAGTADDNDARD